MRRFSTYAAFLLGIAIASVAAQTRPDFSARWVLESPLDAPRPVPRELTVEHTADTLRIDYPSEVGGSYAVEYPIGIGRGVVSGGIGGYPTRTSTQSRAQWRDDALLLERSVSVIGGPQGDRDDYHAEVWSIDSRGRLVIEVTDRNTGEPTTTRRLVYVKR